MSDMTRFICKFSSLCVFHKNTQGTPDEAPNNYNSSGNTGIPLNDTPPSNIPPTNTDSNTPSHNPLSNEIPRNILAFRTITTILAQIQQEQLFKISDVVDMSSAERQEIKISNALSNVAVIDNDIAAVVTHCNNDVLKVVACTPCTPHDKNPDITQSQCSKMISRPWHYLLTKNFHRSDPQPAIAIQEPTIIDTKIPAGLKPDDNEGLKQYIEKCWSHPTLATHLWILSRLLVMKDLPDDGSPPKILLEKLCNRLMPYVITTCYPKMIRRLKNPTLSQPYIKSLKLVVDIPFFDESQQDETSPTEAAHDWLFLSKFVLPATEHSVLRTSIPNITQLALLAKQNKSIRLYTNDTRVEFHALLLELLERFQKSLHGLSDSRGTGDVPTEGSSNFKQYLVAVKLNGYALQKISKGAALRMHLKTIEPCLIEQHRANMSVPKVEEDEAKDEEHKNECDEELEAVQPFVTTEKGVPMPLWKSYRDWLRLMVVHFDAVTILSKYVTSPQFRHKSISMQILVAPPVDNALLPWRELFTNSQLFPTQNMLDPFSTTTNDEILKFLNDATSSNPQESLHLATAALKWWKKHDTQNVIENIKNLERSNLPGWNECAVKLLDMLRNSTAGQSPETSHQITNTIQALCDNAKFFVKLNSVQSFSGTLHCEVCVASLLNYLPTHTAIDSKYSDVLIQMTGFGRVIGVSKRCCPTCRHLLSLLTEGKHLPFLVGGSHNTVTACTIPTWLPGQIVDSMNEFFGGQLRRELVEFMGRSELLRNRTHSTGSRRLSFGSSEGPSDDDLPIDFSIDFSMEQL